MQKGKPDGESWGGEKSHFLNGGKGKEWQTGRSAQHPVQGTRRASPNREETFRNRSPFGDAQSEGLTEMVVDVERRIQSTNGHQINCKTASFKKIWGYQRRGKKATRFDRPENAGRPNTNPHGGHSEVGPKTRHYGRPGDGPREKKRRERTRRELSARLKEGQVDGRSRIQNCR